MSTSTSIQVSRRGSISVHIPAGAAVNNSRAAGGPDGQEHAGGGGGGGGGSRIHIPGAGTGAPLSYRERAKRAIEQTLSPGSEFSFGNSSDELPHNATVNTSSSASLVNTSLPMSRIARASAASASASASFSSASSSSSSSFAAGIRRVTGGIHYVEGVQRPTVNALERLEDALARTNSLVGAGATSAEEAGGSGAAVAREIAYLRNMQQQLASASSRLLATDGAAAAAASAGAGAGPQQPQVRVDPNPASAAEATRRVAASLAAVPPQQVELDRTLERLHQAAAREGVLRSENLRLRQRYETRGGGGAAQPQKKTKSITSKTATRSAVDAAVASETLLSGGTGGAGGPGGANLHLRCALLEEQVAAAERRARVAETSAEAVAAQLRALREQRATGALTNEAELYHRIGAGLKSVEAVAAPLAALERKAAARHEEVTADLANIDARVRRDNAALEAKVQELQRQNASLRHMVDSRVSKKVLSAAEMRGDALMSEVRRLRKLLRQRLRGTPRTANTRTGNEEEGAEKEETKDDGTAVDVVKNGARNAITAPAGAAAGKTEGKEAVEEAKAGAGEAAAGRVSTESSRRAMKIDRALSGMCALDLEHPISSLRGAAAEASSADDEDGGRSDGRRPAAPVPPLTFAMGWAALSVVRDIMRMLDLEDASSVLFHVAKLQSIATSVPGLHRALYAVQELVDQASETKVVLQKKKTTTKRQGGAEDDEEDLYAMFEDNEEAEKLIVNPFAEGQDPSDTDVSTATGKLKTDLRTLLDERRTMWFSQSQSQKLLHEILLQFQMLSGAETLRDVVPALQARLAQGQADRTSLDRVREMFGMSKWSSLAENYGREAGGDGEDAVVGIVRAYTQSQGLVRAPGAGAE